MKLILTALLLSFSWSINACTIDGNYLFDNDNLDEKLETSLAVFKGIVVREIDTGKRSDEIFIMSEKIDTPMSRLYEVKASEYFKGWPRSTHVIEVGGVCGGVLEGKEYIFFVVRDEGSVVYGDRLITPVSNKLLALLREKNETQ